jgi:tetratricopeptide (TPR) repeat protein
MVEITINPDGNVIAARPISGISLLKTAAIEAAKQWRFKPLRKSGSAHRIGLIVFRTPSEIYGNLSQSLSYYQDEIRREPNSWAAHCKLARALRANGLQQKAIEEYQIALRLSPSAAVAWYGLGEIYLDQKIPVQALGAFTRATQVKCDFVEAYISMGWTYGRLDRFDEAVKAFRQALRVDADLEVKDTAYFNIAGLLEKAGRPEEALEARRQLLEVKQEKRLLDPDWESETGVALFANSLAAHYAKLGHYKEAIAAYQRTVEVFPQSQLAYEAYLDMASLNNQTGNKAEAKRIYDYLLSVADQQLKSKPSQFRRSELYYYQGQTYEEMQKEEEAIAAYRKAAELQPEWDKPHLGLSRLYSRRGDEVAAKRESRILQELKEKSLRPFRENKPNK